MTIRQAIESAKNMQRVLVDLQSRGVDPDADIVLALSHSILDDTPYVQLHRPPLTADEIQRDDKNRCCQNILYSVHGARILWISFDDYKEEAEAE